MSGGIMWDAALPMHVGEGEFSGTFPLIMICPSIESIIMDEAVPPPRVRKPLGTWDSMQRWQQEEAERYLGLNNDPNSRTLFDWFRAFILNGAPVVEEKGPAAPTADEAAYWAAEWRKLADQLRAYTATPTTEEVERAFPWLPKEMREPVRLALCHFVAGRADRIKKEAAE